jgi:hypothetical protein
MILTILWPVAWHLHANAILGLMMGASAVPLAATCISLYVAGRKLTPGEKRSALGIWLGRWMLWMGIFLICIAALNFSRWLNLEPDIDYLRVATVARAVGVFALLMTVGCTWFVGPLVLDRIRQGRI